MKNTDYNKMYEKIYKLIDNLTPLKTDCGVLCNKACCKGDCKTGMRLFPYENTTLDVIVDDNGNRVAICNGECNRSERPLSCRIFPFFPTISNKGRVYVEIDDRATLLCPLIKNADEVLFDRKFLNAIKKVGKILSKDVQCLAFLRYCTDEIDTYRKFLG